MQPEDAETEGYAQFEMNPYGIGANSNNSNDSSSKIEKSDNHILN